MFSLSSVEVCQWMCRWQMMAERASCLLKVQDAKEKKEKICCELCTQSLVLTTINYVQFNRKSVHTTGFGPPLGRKIAIPLDAGQQ